MASSNKITPGEWKSYVEGQMLRAGFTTLEREMVRAAFESDLRDKSYGDRVSFFTTVKPGISTDELASVMAELRDMHSVLSKAAKVHLSTVKLDKLEAILHKALVEDKESWF
ncbi:MAG: hypothetical protein Q7S28_04115 [bacterium]|nr:hypothetical protein [bacterium]